MPDIIQFAEFQKMLNKRLFDGSRVKLLQNIAIYPDRFIGLFRPTKPKTKLIQNLTQSHEIRFGDALEEVFTEYFRLLGFNILPKRMTATEDGNTLYVDHLFETNGIIYLIEQKIRDDHDSTKKRGQFRNFENKYYEATRTFTNITIVPIMWFIDDSLVKNKNYYIKEIENMTNSYGCSSKLCYGGELFDGAIINGLDASIWNETLRHLREWKELLPDMPEINFDNESEEVFNEIKELRPSIYRLLFENEELSSQILPIIFPRGDTLIKLKNYLSQNNTPINNYIVNLIDNYLA